MHRSLLIASCFLIVALASFNRGAAAGTTVSRANRSIESTVSSLPLTLRITQHQGSSLGSISVRYTLGTKVTKAMVTASKKVLRIEKGTAVRLSQRASGSYSQFTGWLIHGNKQPAPRRVNKTTVTLTLVAATQVIATYTYAAPTPTPTASPTPAPPPSPTPTPSSHLGTQQWAVVTLNFSGRDPGPTGDQLRDQFTGSGDPTNGLPSVQKFYQSYGIDLQFSFPGPLTIDSSQNTAAPCTGDDYSEQIRLVSAANPSLAHYQGVVVIDASHLDSTQTCSVGARGGGHWAVIFDGGTASHPSSVVFAATHEIGHCEQLNHGGKLEFAPDPWTYTPTSIRWSDDHGNTDSVMGKGSVGFSGIDQLVLGYLKPDQVQSVQQTGDYTILQREDNRPGTHLLRIPKDDRDSVDPTLTQPDAYYLEYETPSDQDARANQTSVNLLLWDGLIPRDGLTTVHPNWEIARLTTAMPTYVDPINGIQITVASWTSASVMLHIDRGTLPPTPAIPTAGLSGHWVNVDASTTGIVDIYIRPGAGGHLLVTATGRCHPTNCDWGTVPATSYDESSFTAQWAFSYATQTLTGHVTGDNLTVQGAFHYTDNSGRKDYTFTAMFRRSP